MKKCMFALFLLLSSTSAAVYSQDFTRELVLAKSRINGADVVALQKALIDIGFAEIGEADGWFGPNTEKAVNKYLAFLGFNPTGKITKEVWKILFTKNAELQSVHSSIKQANAIQIKSLKEMDYDFMGHSTEGGSIKRYFAGKENKVTELSVFGEMGKVEYFVYHVPAAHIIIEKEYQYADIFNVETATVTTTAYYFSNTLSIAIKNGTISKEVLANLEFQEELVQ